MSADPSDAVPPTPLSPEEEPTMSEAEQETADEMAHSAWVQSYLDKIGQLSEDEHTTLVHGNIRGFAAWAKDHPAPVPGMTPAPTTDLPATEEGRDMLAHAVQYDPADAGRGVVAAKIIRIEREAAARTTPAAPSWVTDDGDPQLHVEGSSVIYQTDTDPGDMGEPRVVSEDDITYVAVPSFDLWPAEPFLGDDMDLDAGDPFIAENLRLPLRAPAASALEHRLEAVRAQIKTAIGDVKSGRRADAIRRLEDARDDIDATLGYER